MCRTCNLCVCKCTCECNCSSKLGWSQLFQNLSGIVSILGTVLLIFGLALPGWLSYRPTELTTPRHYIGLFEVCQNSMTQCTRLSLNELPERVLATQALLILGVICLILGVSCFVYMWVLWCCYDETLLNKPNSNRQTSSGPNSRMKIMSYCNFLTLLAAFILGGGILTFTGVMIYISEYDKFVWRFELNYGHSMILSLVASCFAVVAGIVFLIGICLYPNNECTHSHSENQFTSNEIEITQM